MTTRRRFVRTAGALFAASPLPVEAANRLNIGVGTFSYHNFSIDEMIVELQKLQITEIEMSRGEFMLLTPPLTGGLVLRRDSLQNGRRELRGRELSPVRR